MTESLKEKSVLDGITSHRNQHFKCAIQNRLQYECPSCDYATHLKILSQKHEHSSHRILTETLEHYICHKCNRFHTYSALMLLKHHIYGCKGEKVGPDLNKPTITWYKCAKCSYETKFLSEISEHTERSHSFENMPWCECNYCGYKARTAHMVRKHELTHHTVFGDADSFECNFCPYRIGVKSHFNKHMTKSHFVTSPWVSCQYCPYQGVEPSLKDHVDTHHLNRKPAKIVKCDRCPYVTTWKSALKAHQRLQHAANQWFKCYKCYFRTQISASLAHHLQTKHSADSCRLKAPNRRSPDSPAPGAVPWFGCDQCPLKTKLEQTLRQHVKLVHGDPALVPWFRCEHCAYKTKRKRNVSRHVFTQHRVHGDDDYFKCGRCPFRSLTKRSVADHVANFHERAEKSFGCDKCAYKTRKKAVLENHVICKHMAAEDIRWFECERCGYRAKVKFHLNRHMKLKHGEEILGND